MRDTVSQIRRYEQGTAQPTLDVIATDLRHHLAALNQLDPDEQTVIRTLIEATLLRHQARKLAG